MQQDPQEETPSSKTQPPSRVWDQIDILSKAWPLERALLGLQICKALREKLIPKVGTLVFEGRSSAQLERRTMIALKWDQHIIRCKFLQTQLYFNGALTNVERKSQMFTSSGSQLTSDVLAAVLPDGGGLIDADVSHSGLRAKELPIILGCLFHSVELSSLNLSSNHLGDDAAEAMYDAMSELGVARLRSLIAQSSELGAQSAAQLIHCLCNSACLTYLDLSANPLRSNDMRAFTSAVEQCTALCDLRLRETGIDDEAAALLGHSSSQLEQLRTLDLGQNRITDSGAAALALFLPPDSILSLLLDGNMIAPSSLRTLQSALSGCDISLGLGPEPPPTALSSASDHSQMSPHQTEPVRPKPSKNARPSPKTETCPSLDASPSSPAHCAALPTPLAFAAWSASRSQEPPRSANLALVQTEAATMVVSDGHMVLGVDSEARGKDPACRAEAASAGAGEGGADSPRGWDGGAAGNDRRGTHDSRGDVASGDRVQDGGEGFCAATPPESLMSLVNNLRPPTAGSPEHPDPT